MKGVRYEFPSGVIVEFTHHSGCIQPQDAWVEAHQRVAREARVKVFESETPVNRTYWPDKRRWVQDAPV